MSLFANRVADINQAFFKIVMFKMFPCATGFFFLTDIGKAFYRSLDDMHLSVCYMSVCVYKNGTSLCHLLFYLIFHHEHFAIFWG